MIIYKVTFPNSKFYIGKTIYDINKRKREHKRNYNNKNNIIFYKAIRKYGWDNLIWEIIDTAKNQEELDCKEMYWINYYRTYLGLKDCNGYNMTIGGEGTNGYKPNKNTKDKMSKAKLGKYNGENNPMFGKQHTEETKKKISIINSGVNHPNYGKHRSENTKQKISNANKGKNNSMYGKTHSKESKEKMSINRRGNTSKITEEIARQIKIKLYNGENTKNICDELNVTINIVSKIKRLETFKYILPEYNEKIKNSINKKNKITEEIAKEIKIRLINGENNIDIINELNVTRNHVGKIKNLRTWKHVLPELNEILKIMYKK